MAPRYGIVRWEHSEYTRGVLFFNEGKAFDFSWYGPMIAVSTSLESSSIMMDVLDTTTLSTMGGGGGTEQHRSPPTSKDITNRITDQFLLLGYLILTQKKNRTLRGMACPHARLWEAQITRDVRCPAQRPHLLRHLLHWCTHISTIHHPIHGWDKYVLLLCSKSFTRKKEKT